MADYIPLDDSAASLVPYESSPEPPASPKSMTGNNAEFNNHILSLKSMHMCERSTSETVSAVIAEEMEIYGRAHGDRKEINVICPNTVITGLCEVRGCFYIHRFDKLVMIDKPCPKGDKCAYYGLAMLCCPYNHDVPFHQRVCTVVVFNRYGIRNCQIRHRLSVKDDELSKMDAALRSKVDRIGVLCKELDDKHDELRLMQIDVRRERINAENSAKEAAALRAKLDSEQNVRQELIHTARTREAHMRAEFVAIRDRCSAMVEPQQKII